MTRIVALLLSLCSIGAFAQALALPMLERGNGPEPSTLDAHKCPEVACINVLSDLYEGLVAEDASGRLIPGMAERWEMSADGRHWTFHLREDLRWSNGEPLTAEQIVASFRRAFAPKTAAPLVGMLDAVSNAIEVQAGTLPPAKLGIDAPDARTIRIQTVRQVFLPSMLILPVAYPVYLPAVEKYGDQHTRPGRLVSNGAYRLETWTPQANLIVGKNRYFHDTVSVGIARVRFHVTEDAAAEVQRFAAGDLHITEAVPPQPLTKLRARFGTQVRIAPYNAAFWLGFNLTQPPFKDAPQLREALSLAVDRDKLTRYITGLGEAPAYGIVPPGIQGYTPAKLYWADWTQARRDARAKALYRAAGYSDANPLTIEFRYNTSASHRRMALAVAAMWRDTLGVRVRLRNEEWKVFIQNRKQRSLTQVFRGGWVGDGANARNFLGSFSEDGVLNWPGYVSPRYRDSVARADAARSEAARNAWLRAAETYLLHDHALIPLYFYTSKHLVANNVRGYEANPLDRHPSRWLRLRK